MIGLFAAAITAAAYIVIPIPRIYPPSQNIKTTVDWAGGAIVTIGLVMLMFALAEGDVVGWETPWISALIVLSVLFIVAFVVWQWFLETRTNRSPLMKISIWKNYRFAAAMVTMLLFFASFNNFLIFASY